MVKVKLNERVEFLIGYRKVEKLIFLGFVSFLFFSVFKGCYVHEKL